MNIAFVRLDFKKEYADSLESMNRNSILIIEKQKSIIDIQKDNLDLKDRIISDHQKVEADSDKIISTDEKKIKSLKIQRGGILVIAAILTVKILLTH